MVSILDYCESVGGDGGAPLGGRKAKSGAPAGRPDNVGSPPEEDVAAALEGLTTTTSECDESLAGCREEGAPCASRRVLEAITEFVTVRAAEAGEAPGGGPAAGAGGGSPPAASPLPTAPTAEAEAVREAAAILGCTSESCVLAHPDLRSFIVERSLLPPSALDADLERRFKAAGPRDSLALTSNHNIDGTLRRWARTFPEFYPCPFAMMDFDKTDDELGRIDLVAVLEGRAPVDLGPGFGRVARPCTVFACVVNTDTSRGDGRHWVCVVCDCRAKDGKPWTVEYFNSAGNPPPKAMVGWMERTRARLATYRAGLPGGGGGGGVETVAVTDVDHQESQTECGLYALFYIRRRLEGAPIADFEGEPIPDAAMTEFRKHVFRSGH